jgi:O-succinylbenzoic acid--CoA ligase
VSRLRRLAVPAGRGALGVLDPLAAALDGSGPALALEPSGRLVGRAPRPRKGELPEDLALVVTTSGSSGAPKRVMLTAANLLASAGAAYEMIGGPGAWLLALPAHHIGGVQVLVRALLGTEDLTVLDLTGGFTAVGFVAAATSMPPTADPTYVSLVPTQLARLLEDPAATEVLAGFEAVLVGGAHTSAEVRVRATAAGVRLVRTYGMTETAGGCVYDGQPLGVSEVHIDNDRHVVLGGATVAHGYLGLRQRTLDCFHTDADGVRWFRTEDLGRLDDAGSLHVTGRADDLINTGGIKVAPGPVEDALVRYLPGVRDAVVLGVPDPQWGEVVAAAVTLEPRASHSPTAADARAALRGVVPDAALPKLLYVIDAIPLLGPGKPDKSRLAAAFGDRMGL